MNRSKSEIDLAPRRKQRKRAELLTTPTDNLLAHKNVLWETRRKKAARELRADTPYVPKFEQKKEPEYDGYSRRDRHHLTPTAHVGREKHVEEVDDGFSMSTVDYGSSRRGSASATKH
jgi:hypothetical protein